MSEQMIVIHRLPHGETKAYGSAYSDEQAQRVAADCRRRHGSQSHTRIVNAREFPPNTLRGMS